MMDDRLQTPAYELNLTEHCNLRCAGCDHSSQLLSTHFMSFEDFKADLVVLSKVLKAKEIKLLGGEPLLHPQFMEFLRFANEIDASERVVVVTNGVLLHKMPEEAWQLLDGMWLSLYPGVKLQVDLEAVKATAAANKVALWAKETGHFHMSVLNQPIADPKLVQSIYAHCSLAHKSSCHTVHEGRYYKCSPAPFMEPRQALRGTRFPNRQVDGVRLRDNLQLKEDLLKYLGSKEPLMACQLCLGTVGKFFKHHQLNKDGLAAELRADHSNVRDLIDLAQLEGPGYL